jgi:hypothetical protein
MIYTFLATHTEYSKYAAWMVILILFVLGASGLKSAVATLLLKLYEVFIEKNALP